MGSSSIFGGRETKKDERRPLAAAEGQDRGAVMASSRSGSGDPSLVATTGPVTSGSSERVIEVDETPVDRYVKFLSAPAGGSGELGKCSDRSVSLWLLHSQLAFLHSSTTRMSHILPRLTPLQDSFPSVS